MPGPPHVSEAGHGGLAVAAGQLPGPLEAVRRGHEGEGGLHVPGAAEPPRHEAAQLRELLAGEQHGRRGQAEPQVRRGGFSWDKISVTSIHTGCPISKFPLCFCHFLGFWSTYTTQELLIFIQQPWKFAT